MRFDLDMGEGSNQIKGFTPGQIKINNEIYTHNIIVTPDAILPWTLATFEQLTRDNIEELLALKPEVVLIGTGHTPQFLSQTLLHSFYEKKVGIEVMTTAAACRTYNVIMAEGRRVVAALFL